MSNVCKDPCGWEAAIRMSVLETITESGPMTRRALFTVLPALGCLGCAQAQAQQGEHSWTEKSDLTWEEIFRFAYQKELIPMMKELAAQVGREKFTAMVKQAVDEVVRKKNVGRPPSIPDLVTLAAGAKRMPPLMQHALDFEIVEQTPQAFEYRVKKCLWAKAFRDGDAADIGYAMVCYPDYAVAKSLNPKLRLTRNRTLMQGDDSCGLRYEMEG